MIGARSNPCRAPSKDRKIEEYEHSLTILWDAGIGDPIDLVLRKYCTKGGLIKVFRHAKDHIKTMSSEKNSYYHKLEEWQLGDIRSLSHCVFGLTSINKYFQSTSIKNEESK